MFERFRRSWQLTKTSWRVLWADKELMLLPIFSVISVLVVCASFAVPLAFVIDVDVLAEGNETLLSGLGLLFYVLSYSVSFFFQAAVIAGATERMRGGNPTLGSALAAARSRLGPLLLWGVVAGTVGFVIKSIQERSELVGKIIMGLLGGAWSLTTFFMVPVLVFEDHGIKGSFKRSWRVFRETWGETVVGSGGIGLATFLMMILVILLVTPVFAMGFTLTGIALAVLGLVVVGVVSSALQGVYVAALYRYATEGNVPVEFGDQDLEAAFVKKR